MVVGTLPGAVEIETLPAGGSFGRRGAFLGGFLEVFFIGQLVHELPPCFLRKLVEELHTLAGVHGVDDGVEFTDGPGVQQYVGVVVGKRAGELGGEWDGKFAEEVLLLRKRQGYEHVRGLGEVELLEHVDGLA